MNFDQTCIDTLLGGGKELIRFDDLDFIFKATLAFRNAKFRPKNRVSTCYM